MRQRHAWGLAVHLALGGMVVIFASASHAGLRVSPPAFGNPAGVGDNVSELSPVLASSDAGTVIALTQVGLSAISQRDIFMLRSIDYGDTWSVPEPLNTTGADEECGPPAVVWLGGSEWLASWSLRPQSGEFDRDIMFVRSVDDGETWTAPARLDPASSSDGLRNDIHVRLAASGDNVVAVWESAPLNTSISGSDIYFARSSDAGATWSAPAVLNSTAVAQPGIVDVFPTIGVDADGNWMCVWTTSDDNSSQSNPYEIMFSRSTNNGVDWSAAQILVEDSIMRGYNSATPVGLASNGDGGWIVVWGGELFVPPPQGNDVDILFSRSADGGATWSNPLPLNSYFALDDFPVNANDEQPKIAWDGQDGLLVAWRSDYIPGEPDTSSEFNIFVAGSEDFGETWSEPLQVNHLNPGPDGYYDELPAIVSTRNDHWLVAWNHRFNFSGGERSIQYSKVFYDEGPAGIYDFSVSPDQVEPGTTVRISFRVGGGFQGEPEVLVEGYPATRVPAKSEGFTYEYSLTGSSGYGPVPIVITIVDLDGNEVVFTSNALQVFAEVPAANTATVLWTCLLIAGIFALIARKPRDSRG